MVSWFNQFYKHIYQTFSAEVFGFSEAIDIPSGFLVVGKNDGAVSLADVRNVDNVTINDVTTASNDGTFT